MISASCQLSFPSNAIFFITVPEAIRGVAESAGIGWLAEGRFMLFGAFIVLLMVFRPEGVMTRTLQDRMGGAVFRRKSVDIDNAAVRS